MSKALWPGTPPVADSNANSNQSDRNSTEKLSVDAHQRSDIDSGLNAQHHTLGIGPSQSSPGDHIHDGKSSRKISTAVNASDVVGLDTFIASYIASHTSVVTNIITPTYVLNVIQANPLTTAGYIRTSMLAVFFGGSRNTDAWRQLVMTAFVALGCTNSTSA